LEVCVDLMAETDHRQVDAFAEASPEVKDEAGVWPREMLLS
jgi:hypothetical protein